MSRLHLLFGVIVLIAGAAAPAAAHRLDEYLQATRIGIERERLQVEINLTPGANIASQVASLIDADVDGVLSETERADYARRVLDAMTLAIDGGRAVLAVDGYEFPPSDAMAAGVGTIRIRASTAWPTGVGRHHLAYSNSHRPEMSVYLVNALVPADPRVVIGTPQRDRLQRGLDLEFDIRGDQPWLQAGWLGIAIVVLGTLASARRGNHAALRAFRLRPIR
jgi:hypothetical protein